MKNVFLIPTAMLVLFSHTNASAQGQCPGALSIPAQQAEVQCLAETNSSRCGGGLPPALCHENNNRALANGLLSQDAYDWLEDNGYCAVNIDGVHMIVAICPVGCFEQDTAILALAADGSENWVAAKDIGLDNKLFGLKADALLSSPALDGRSIKRMAYGDEDSDLYVFALSNGHKLRVTQHHGMVLADGRVVEARKVIEGDVFVALDGTDVFVESIGREPTDADVYNFFLDVDTPQEHVLAAEGVLVGDLAWQSTLVSELDSIALRR